ncbi:MAG: response regulator [Pseudomonadota bacterium]
MTSALKNILCVDDDSNILDIVRLSLEKVGGFSVTACNDGQSAVDKADEINPDLIILDVMMPGLDGPSTLKRMRTNTKLDKIPVIFMTARVQSSEIEDYVKLGAAGVISKPFDPMTMPGEVASIWKKFHNL